MERDELILAFAFLALLIGVSYLHPQLKNMAWLHRRVPCAMQPFPGTLIPRAGTPLLTEGSHG